jgi:hypothetical protein
VSDRAYLPAGKGTQQICNQKGKFKDTPNYCNTTPFKDENGHADGMITFVFVDCGSGRLLPMDKQESAYRYPGVSTGIKQ